MLGIVPFPAIDPVLVEVGPFAIRWYALAYIAGLVIGWRIVRHLAAAPPRAATVEQVDDFLTWAVLGVILGGRLGYVLFYKPGFYLQHPLEIFAVWQGGMSFHGGLLGVALAIVLFARRAGVPVLALADMAAAVTPIGLGLGRIANFINGELWGRPTDGPFGVVFCNETIRELNYGACPAGVEPRHPSQLYEAALEGVALFAIINFATLKFDSLRRPGMNVGLFLLFYGLSRALLETVREPDAHMPEALRGYVTMGMLLSLPMILAGLWLIRRAFAQPKLATA